jgi:hypothetical protein
VVQPKKTLSEVVVGIGGCVTAEPEIADIAPTFDALLTKVKVFIGV